MSEEETGALIDLVARHIAEQLPEEAADAVATQVVGDLQSRFYLIPRPPGEAGAALTTKGARS